MRKYTRAIAEGFSKRSTGKANSSIVDQSIVDEDSIGAMDIFDAVHPFDFLDGNLVELEESGKRWRSNRDVKTREKTDNKHGDEKERHTSSSNHQNSK